MRWARRAGGVAALLLLIALVRSTRALACTFVLVYPKPVPTDPRNVGSDHSPPRLHSVDYSLDRPEEGRYADCGMPATLTLHVDADDDQTAPEALRYRSEGFGSENASWFDYPEPVDALWFHLVDEKPLGQRQPLETMVRVWAIDAAGNESEPTDVRVVEQDAPGGCSLARRASRPAARDGAAAALVLLSFVAGLHARQSGAKRLHRVTPGRSFVLAARARSR